MTTLTERPGTALLVIDVQNGVAVNAYARDSVVANIAALVERARSADVPVVWVQHSSGSLPRDSQQWQYVPELPRRDGEPLVHKRYGDSFEDTDLETVLATLATGHLVVAGMQTDQCIRGTIHGAFTRGYDVTLVQDAHTTEDFSSWGAPSPELVIAHTNLYWQYESAPGRRAAVVETAKVDFTAKADVAENTE